MLLYASSAVAKASPFPPVVPPPPIPAPGEVSVAVLGDGTCEFSTVLDENNYAYTYASGGKKLPVLVLDGKRCAAGVMETTVYGGSSEEGYISSLDIVPGFVFLRRAYGTGATDKCELEKWAYDGSPNLTLVKKVSAAYNGHRGFAFQVLGPRLYVDGGKSIYDLDLNLVETGKRPFTYDPISYDPVSGNGYISDNSRWFGSQQSGSNWVSQPMYAHEFLNNGLPGRTQVNITLSMTKGGTGYAKCFAMNGRVGRLETVFTSGSNFGTDTARDIGTELSIIYSNGSFACGLVSGTQATAWETKDYLVGFNPSMVKLIGKADTVAGKPNKVELTLPDSVTFLRSSIQVIQDSASSCRQTRTNSLILTARVNGTYATVMLRVA